MILLVTLLPAPEITAPPEDLPSIFCLLCGERGGADGILNFMLFVPLGIGLMATIGREIRVVVFVVTLSIVIEVLQGMIPGRYPTLGDVVYNTLGGATGITLSMKSKQLLWPSRRLAGALTVAMGAVAGGLFFTAGILLAPSFPATIYYGQWTADLHYMEAYEGQVLEASLGSMFLGSERTSNPELAVDLLRSGAPLAARAVAGPAPAALAPIVSIYDESAVEILVLGADATDLVLRMRYSANDLRLDRPDLRVRGALAATRPGDTIRLRAERASEGYSLWLDEHEYASLRHTPGEGWALLLHPEHTAAWLDFALRLAWVAGPLILAGWWAPGLGWVVGAFSIALSGMVMASAMGPLMHMAVAEILAAFAGVVLGVVLRRTLGRTHEGSTMPHSYASVGHEKAKTGTWFLMTGANSGFTRR